MINFSEYLKQANEIVNGWPKWKQNILANSSKATNSEPRTMTGTYGESLGLQLARRAEIAARKENQKTKKQAIDIWENRRPKLLQAADDGKICYEIVVSSEKLANFIEELAKKEGIGGAVLHTSANDMYKVYLRW